MESASDDHTYYLRLIVLPACLSLQSCVVIGVAGDINGMVFVTIGSGVVYGGYRLAIRTVLKHWAMKLLKAGALIFFLG